jgi:hypothetical protein
MIRFSNVKRTMKDCYWFALDQSRREIPCLTAVLSNRHGMAATAELGRHEEIDCSAGPLGLRQAEPAA